VAADMCDGRVRGGWRVAHAQPKPGLSAVPCGLFYSVLVGLLQQKTLPLSLRRPLAPLGSTGLSNAK
jgi:uncharacterized membrane protein YeiB